MRQSDALHGGMLCEQNPSRRNRRSTGHDPVFGIQRFILLKIENDRSDPIDHLCCREMKAIFSVAFLVGWRRSQLSHHDDQISLRCEDLIGKEIISCNGPCDTKRGVQLINASIGVHTRIGFR